MSSKIIKWQTDKVLTAFLHLVQIGGYRKNTIANLPMLHKIRKIWCVPSTKYKRLLLIFLIIVMPHDMYQISNKQKIVSESEWSAMKFASWCSKTRKFVQIACHHGFLEHEGVCECAFPESHRHQQAMISHCTMAAAASQTQTNERKEIGIDYTWREREKTNTKLRFSQRFNCCLGGCSSQSQHAVWRNCLVDATLEIRRALCQKDARLVSFPSLLVYYSTWFLRTLFCSQAQNHSVQQPQINIYFYPCHYAVSFLCNEPEKPSHSLVTSAASLVKFYYRFARELYY